LQQKLDRLAEEQPAEQLAKLSKKLDCAKEACQKTKTLVERTDAKAESAKNEARELHVQLERAKNGSLAASADFDSLEKANSLLLAK